MGWSSAVGVMQEVAETLCSFGELPDSHMLLRNRVVPPWLSDTLKEAHRSRRAWYHVYLDNFCAAEKVELGEDGTQGRQFHQAVEASWGEWGVLSSQSKRVDGAPMVHELGAAVGSSSKLLGGSGERFLKLVQSTLVVIGQPRLKFKWIQMIAGRWVHVLQFRRPGMIFLNVHDLGFYFRKTPRANH